MRPAPALPLPPLLIAAALPIAGAALALGAPVAALAVACVAALAGALLLLVRSPPPPVRTAADAALAPLPAHPDFAGLVDALESPLLLVADGQVTVANAAARALLGDFIVGADVRTAIRHPAAADRLARGEGAAAGDSGAESIDLVGIGRAGERWAMRIVPLADGSRLVTLADRTAGDAVERMRADFVANASHELRTPLAAIIGYVETLSEPAAGDDAALRARFLAIIAREARRMQRLVDDLLSISRIEASKGQPPATRLDLAALAREVVGEIASAGSPRAADIALAADAPAWVRADRAQLSQLIHNIVGNAMIYGRADTPVAVRVAAAEGMVELSVADRGDGIARDAIPRLTERFYRVDSARSRAAGGTGLGLAIVKHVVERHHGRLAIDSVVGEGSRVTVRLPGA